MPVDIHDTVTKIRLATGPRRVRASMGRFCLIFFDGWRPWGTRGRISCRVDPAPDPRRTRVGPAPGGAGVRRSPLDRPRRGILRLPFWTRFLASIWHRFLLDLGPQVGPQNLPKWVPKGTPTSNPFFDRFSTYPESSFLPNFDPRNSTKR